MNSLKAPRSWKYLTLEGVLIVLSVLLAFGINEWRRDSAEREVTHRAIETVRREILANQVELEVALANHERVLEQMRSEGDDENFGIRPAVLRNSAWSTAQATGATVQMDYEITETAAMLHELQNLQKEAQRFAFEQLFAISRTAAQLPSADVQRLRLSTWSSLVGLEHKLMEEYDHALEVVGG